MEAIKLREKLIQEISMADESLLKAVDDVVEQYHSHHPPVVSEPLSVEQYNLELKRAEDDISNGDSFSHEEVAEIIKRWGKR
ncbi:hypothetical protein ACLI1A_08860 [Flavobacterium sp. RHBU_3]|uniref:hypothetical protein n=1 Tax=Flavobacterium sp. RHBU_3 TaxID=3391184 RepID=UPI0039854E94